MISNVQLFNSLLPGDAICFTYNLFNITPSYGMLHDSTKPYPESMPIWKILAFTSDQLHIMTLDLDQYHQGNLAMDLKIVSAL